MLLATLKAVLVLEVMGVFAPEFSGTDVGPFFGLPNPGDELRSNMLKLMKFGNASVACDREGFKVSLAVGWCEFGEGIEAFEMVDRILPPERLVELLLPDMPPG